MFFTKFSNPIVPQSHGNVEDFEGEVGKSNVSYNTIKVQDPKPNASPEIIQSFNVFAFDNYLEKLIVIEESALDIFLGNPKNNEDIPSSYLARLSEGIKQIEEESMENRDEINKQQDENEEVQQKETLARVKIFKKMEENAIESRDIQAQVVDKSIETRVLTRETIGNSINDKRIREQELKAAIDAKFENKQMLEEQYFEDKTTKYKNIGIEYAEDAEDVSVKNIGVEDAGGKNADVNVAANASDSSSSSFEKANQDRAMEASIQEGKPEQMQISFGVNLLV